MYVRFVRSNEHVFLIHTLYTHLIARDQQEKNVTIEDFNDVLFAKLGGEAEMTCMITPTPQKSVSHIRSLTGPPKFSLPINAWKAPLEVEFQTREVLCYAQA